MDFHKPSQEQLLEVIKIQTEMAQQGLDLGGVMGLMVERIPRLIDADGAAIELVEGQDMVYQSAAGIARGQEGVRLRASNSLSGLCVASGEVLRCDDTETDPRADREACHRMGLRSMLLIPLKHQNETVGVLKAISKKPAHFSERDAAVLGLLAELASASMYFATKYSNSNLFSLATHDSLTGLANRALFMARLRDAIDQSRREQLPVAVLMIDIDHFKLLNQTYGHRIGDAVLVEFAQRLKHNTRLTDTQVRLGGDEFCVIVSPVDFADSLEVAVQRLEGAITLPFIFEDRTYYLQASIGAAQYPTDAQDINQLIDLANQCMLANQQVRHHEERLKRDYSAQVTALLRGQ